MGTKGTKSFVMYVHCHSFRFIHTVSAKMVLKQLVNEQT